MTFSPDNNPTPPADLAGCQALIRRQSAELAVQAATVEQLSAAVKRIENERQVLEREKQQLQAEFDAYVRKLFQSRRERYIQDPNQLLLDLGDSPAAEDVTAGLAEAVAEAELRVKAHSRRRNRKPRSEKFPEHLSRTEILIDVPEEVATCPTHGPRQLIGYDTVEKMCMRRPELWIEVRKYPKYSCAGAPQCGVASTERPTGLVEGDRYDTSIAAEVITCKYGYHLPIYRQQDWFAGSGWLPGRSTLLNLLTASVFLIAPLVAHFRRLVLASGVIGTDDTGVTLLLPQNIPKLDLDDPKSRRIHEVFEEARKAEKTSVRAKMWAYRSVTVPLNVFDFTVSRHRDGPDRFLEGFEGKLMADCYSGYQGIALRTSGAIQRGACVAHARRKVMDGQAGYPVEANRLLAQFQLLYDIETQARDMSSDERREYRQRHAAPIWTLIKEWLESDAALQLTPKSNLAQARQYLLNHWDPLLLYLSDGRMPIDNNDVEQLMKVIATGRKNWQFVGSVAAGERAAALFTLVSSAARNDLDVWLYVKDVLDQLLAGSTDYESLRPDVWKQSHPEAIRTYREEERRDRADRSQHRRATRRAQAAAQRSGS